MAEERSIGSHRQWLNEIQPVGLVVSPPALGKFGWFLPQQVVDEWHLFRQLTLQPRCHSKEDDHFLLTDFPRFAESLLGWNLNDLAGRAQLLPMPDRFRSYLEDLQQFIEPDFVLLDPDVSDPSQSVPLLIKQVSNGLALDKPCVHDGPGQWRISPMSHFLRLLRETGQPAGLLCNGEFLRLVFAPEGETSGYMDFPINDMATTAGRNLLAAMLMLLCESRVVLAAPERRLTALMQESRKYQNVVSVKLAVQVQMALDALLCGFQTADPDLISGRSGNTADHVYDGLLTVILRLVFILYAEDWGSMSDHDIYNGSYSLFGLFERLIVDETHFPDAMDQRFGAWSHLLTFFRIIFRGGSHGGMVLSARYGQLFLPDGYPFLEGRNRYEAWSDLESVSPPAVPDGAVLAVLRNLLVLDGERLSYRSLDVETIGSVYEAMMGFQIERARNPCLALGKHCAVVDLKKLLAQKPSVRKKYLKAVVCIELSAKQNNAVKSADSLDQLIIALQARISKRRPHVIQPWGLYLQPGEERRKTGSHYTPRALTERIVRHALEPVLAELGAHPNPEQILDLKVCDPAMGSGAFLVETCRFLGNQLVSSWDYHKRVAKVPAGEDRNIYARRLVAGRCCYGIDKNPLAVSLAKLSLWLVTLAKSQPFTFLDHALKCGDTLLGLSPDQITGFNWVAQKEPGPLADLTGHIEVVSKARRCIQALGDGNHHSKQFLHRQAEDELDVPRLVGDLVLVAFFSDKKQYARETARKILQEQVAEYQNGHATRNELEDIRSQFLESQRPFHMELEYPEVFVRANPGFDAFVGNPPFCGGLKISTHFGAAYRDWVLQLHDGAHGNGDLVAHFFRRSFNMLRQHGSFGLIATNTIAQGDTRSTGLAWICQNGGTVFNSNRRYKWPGAAAVVVSTVCARKGSAPLTGCILDGQAGSSISAFLVRGNRHADPARLIENKGKSYQGAIVHGSGFTFDDTDPKGIATSIEDMNRLIAKDPHNQAPIQPYIGGSEVNRSPVHAHHRYVINLNEMSLEQAGQFPELLAIVASKVKPVREHQKDNPIGLRRQKYWWRWGGYTPALFRCLKKIKRTLVIARVQQHLAVTFMPTNYIFSEQLVVITLEQYSAFCILQSNFHETWARAFSSTMKDDLRYTTTDCFETYPFPASWQGDLDLEEAGQCYFEWRAEWMKSNNLGMTKAYNLFHDKDELECREMEPLRVQQRAMDHAVLRAYGWEDEVCMEYGFFLDYEDEVVDSSKKRKPWRYRWSDEVRDKVLGLLLALNQQRDEAGSGERVSLENKKRADEIMIQPLRGQGEPYGDVPLFETRTSMN